MHTEPILKKGNIFQGHLYPIHTEEEARQSLRALLQDSKIAQSDHIMYAYNYLDLSGESVHGFSDDGEWQGGSVIMDMLKNSNTVNIIVMVSRKFGGVYLGKERFDLIKNVPVKH